MKNMKIIIIALLTCLTMSSCEKWFDVSPKSDVKSDDLFKDENGFWDVLTGVYSIMVTPSAYGRELSFGYLDVMLNITIKSRVRHITIIKQKDMIIRIHKKKLV